MGGKGEKLPRSISTRLESALTVALLGVELRGEAERRNPPGGDANPHVVTVCGMRVAVPESGLCGLSPVVGGWLWLLLPSSRVWCHRCVLRSRSDRARCERGLRRRAARVLIRHPKIAPRARESQDPGPGSWDSGRESWDYPRIPGQDPGIPGQDPGIPGGNPRIIFISANHNYTWDFESPCVIGRNAFWSTV